MLNSSWVTKTLMLLCANYKFGLLSCRDTKNATNEMNFSQLVFVSCLLFSCAYSQGTCEFFGLTCDLCRGVSTACAWCSPIGVCLNTSQSYQVITRKNIVYYLGITRFVFLHLTVSKLCLFRIGRFSIVRFCFMSNSTNLWKRL